MEAGWAADKGVAAFVEAKEAVRGACDADAGALAEDEGAGALAIGVSLRGQRAEPERAGGAEVCAVEAAVDMEGGGEAARTAG